MEAHPEKQHARQGHTSVCNPQRPTRRQYINSCMSADESATLFPRPCGVLIESSFVASSSASGTTGDPKGVLLTHSAVVAAVTSVQSYCKDYNLDFNDTDRLLSYLPLAHIFDRYVSDDKGRRRGRSEGSWARRGNMGPHETASEEAPPSAAMGFA
jgi:hypothetical protein